MKSFTAPRYRLIALTGVVTALFAGLSAAADTPASATGTLPATVQRVIEGHGVPQDSFSIVVQEVGAGAPTLSFNAAKALNPASTIKLLTTWLALEELGPAYTWPTEVFLEGKLERGTLHGDLLIKGYGDPYFITERLWSLQRELRLRGLRSISGDLVIDNSYFADEYGDPASFDGEGLRVYNVTPDAFLVNFQAVRFYFMPDRSGRSVKVLADPLPANLVIENRLTLGNGYCGGYQNGIAIDVANPDEGSHVILSGRYRSDCDEYAMTRSVLTGPSYAYGVFRALWEESGGSLAGEWRRADKAAAPVGYSGELPADGAIPAKEPFVRVDSPPLSDVIAYINKYSNNVMARHLFLTMGAEAFEPPATQAKARRAASEALERHGLNFPELRIDNGAGLSRNTRIAAASLAQVLLLAWQRPWAAEYISSLSLAGLDGTMRRRFVTGDLTGQMHLKTGRLKNVYATAGYVHARSGRNFVMVVLQNYSGADKGPGEELQASLLRWIYEQ